MSSELDFDQTRVQFVNSLAGLAEHFRQCAHYADQMAALLNAGHIPPMAIPPMMPPPIAAPEQHANGHKRKAEALEDEDESGKKRKSRKPKDPNAPKRPPSSYILFQNEVRKEIKARNPNIQNHELLQMISQQWASMTPEQKNVYVEAMAKAKEAYTQEKAAYDARSPEEVAAAEAALANQAKKVRKPRAKSSGEKAAKKKAATSAAATAPTKEATDDSDEDEDEEEDEEGYVAIAAATGHGDESSEEEDEEEDEDDNEEDEEDEPSSPPRKKKQQVVSPPSKKQKNRS